MKMRRLSASGVAVVALAVLLVISVSIGATLAWFASQDSAGGTFTLGSPVIVTVTDTSQQDTSTLAITIPSETLLPGVLIDPDIVVTLSASTTATILRASLTVLATDVVDAETLQQSFVEALSDSIAAGWKYNGDDNYYYYLGTPGDDARVMETPAETSALTDPEFGATLADYGVAVATVRDWDENVGDTVLASVVPGAAAKSVNFLTQTFRLPTTLTNEVANSTITINFVVDAVQDYLVVGDTNVLPTVDNAATIFNQALGE